MHDQGHSVEAAVREAAVRRLRQIVTTSLATVAGAVPLAAASGAGSGARSAIGVVVVFGVTLASAVTLYVVPLLYHWLAPYTGAPQTVSRRLAALLGR